MIDGACARCHLVLDQGDLVTEVRIVTTRPRHDGPGVYLATDRTSLVAHLTCPQDE